MSMRIKAALVIMSIVFVITAAYLFLNLSFTRSSIIQAIEQDLSLTISIANDMVAAEIGLLKSNADSLGERLLKADSVDEMMAIIEDEHDLFPEFISLTVYNRTGIVLNYGDPINHNVFINENNYIQTAFNGEPILSTTHYNSLSGAFVIHVFVPMGRDLVLSATIPGMYFTELIENYRLWQTGNVYIVDEKGTVIANYRHEMVLDLLNFIEGAKNDPVFKDIGDFFQTMITTENGRGTYTLEGIERLCVYERIKGSTAGWRIAVAVPLSESPLSKVQNDMILSALVFLAVGMIASILLSGLVSRPFYRIEEQNRNLAELNEEVMAASEAKTNFLANMSHEMRTPLNAIIGMSELTLETGQLSEEATSNLEKIYNAGETLLYTVNDILDISKIEAGRMELVPVDYDMPSLMNDAITQSIMRRGEKPIKFILDVNENLPARLFGDDIRIKQLLNNLLSNAFKYTNEGSVKLTIFCERPIQTEDTVWMTIKVTDTGKGIKKEDMDRLFGNYAQIDVKTNRKIEGTGLGLAITKKVVEMMEGTIGVESEYGKGSVFTIRIKQTFVTDAVIGTEVVENLKNFHYSDQKRRYGLQMARLDLSYARVLVVDDVETNLDVAKGMMKPYNLQVDCVLDGLAAIDAIAGQNVTYNAVFMDHMMPGIDGIEATKIIRGIKSDYAKNIPIIALTANALAGNEKMFLSNGFNAFLPKPIEIAGLDEVLKNWVQDKTRKEEFVTEDSKPAAPAYDFKIEGVDFNKGLERFGNNWEVFLGILRSYTVNTPNLLAIVKKADKDNLPEYAVNVHGIKSSSRSIGAEDAGSKAEALEKASKAGDFDFVAANTAALVQEIERIIGKLAEILRNLDSKTEKPKKDKPDSTILANLSSACDAFDIGGVNAAMKELDAFDYESDDGLMVWLKENVDQMNFSEITEKLAGLI